MVDFRGRGSADAMSAVRAPGRGRDGPANAARIQANVVPLDLQADSAAPVAPVGIVAPGVRVDWAGAIEVRARAPAALAASGPVAGVGTGGLVPTVMVAVHRVAGVGTGGLVPTVRYPVVMMVDRALLRGAKAVSLVLDQVAPARTLAIDRLGRSTLFDRRGLPIVSGPVAGADRIDLLARSTVIDLLARSTVTVPVPAAVPARAASGPVATERIVPERTDRAVTEASAASGPAVLARGDHREDRHAPIGSTTRSADAAGRGPSEAGVTSSGHPAPHRSRRRTAAVAVARSPCLSPRRRPSCGNQPAGKAVTLPRWTPQSVPK